MKPLKLENQGLNNYLVYEVEKDENIDSLALGMLANNSIAGIAPVIHTQMDDNIFFKYNISDKVSAKDYFSGLINRKRLLNIFSGVLSAVMAAEEYMIDVNTLIFDLDYIFVNPSTGETEMICVPIMNNETEPLNLGMFFKNILFSGQFDSSENSNYVAVIMNFLNSNPTLSAENFKKTIDELTGDEVVSGPTGQRTVPVSQPQTSVAEPQGNNSNVQPSIQSVPTQQSVPPKGGISAGKGSSSMNAPSTSNAIKTGKKAASQGMAIPGAPQMSMPQQQNVVQTENAGEVISLMYLMQHYNKENVALYKEQQRRKKENGAAAKATKPAKTAKGKKGAQPQGGYAVPGAPVSPQSGAQSGMSQVKKAQGNSGFAIPGQAAPSISASGAQSPQMAGMSRMNNNQAQPVQPQAPVQSAQSPQPTYTPPPLSQGTANFGETVVLNQDMGAGAGETTVLNSAQTLNPYLIRVKTGEKIVIDKQLFRIGKERSIVDYFIPDNTTISRNHMNIVSHDNEYFVVDLKSTNHTYVNGVKIPENVETKVSHGTKIRISNEEFEFNMF